MDAAPIERGFVEVLNGKIAMVSSGVPNCVGDGDIDAALKTLYPGFIDAHSHIGFIGGGDDSEPDDLNETGDPVTPHLRAIDGFNFSDACLRDAVEAGITAAVTGVGSANPIGGDCIAVKTHGLTADDMLIRRVGIKFALGENPKRTYADMGEGPRTRMAAAAMIREALFKARRYGALLEAADGAPAGLPEYDAKSEALLPLLNRELKAFFHCHRADDIMTAVRVAKEFDLKYALIHCTAGRAVAETLGGEKAEVIIGPVIVGADKREQTGHDAATAGVLYNSGVKIVVCTDHSETPVQYQRLSAACCVKAGLPRMEALRAITINAAEIAGIADRVGSITVGKDADLVLLDGEPFDIMTNAVLTMIDGKTVFRQKRNNY
jgi:imidazolonepropionase-like amidohydrolase